jgi:Mn2+/Fe2+ NRAMP family transporter
VKKLFEIALGIVTSIGGFLEIGSITTAAQAGASYRYQLVWPIVLGTACLVVLVEMSGRFAAVSKHTIPDALRERFGLHAFLWPFLGVLVVSLLVLVAELAGVGIGLELLTGVKLVWWMVPATFVAWLILWKGNFGVIEKGISLLGLVTLAFVIAARRLGPEYGEIARGIVPSLPNKEPAHYWFLVVSILGASISPYLFFFYSGGAIEEKWDDSYLSINRATSVLGIGFGGFLSVAVLVVAALVLAPRGIKVEDYHELAPLLQPAFGKQLGIWLLGSSLVVTCLGAAVEIALASAYLAAQGFGWNWGKDVKPGEDARFSMVYTIVLVVAMIPSLLGADPLKVTSISMALTAATLPLSTLPFLVLANDERYLQEHTNGRIGNAIVLLIALMAGVLAIVSIPLEIVGGG